MSKTDRLLLTLVACGMAGGPTGIALAQPSLINISGATLQENFFVSPASTNDFIDVDGDGVAGSLGTGVEQLAPSQTPSNTSQRWAVQYRAVGSGNGLAELVAHGQAYAVEIDCDEICSAAADKAFFNRLQYISGGSGSSSIFNAGNPGGAPLRTLTDGSFTASYAFPPSSAPGGVLIDIAPMDVPTKWFVKQAGMPVWNATPTSPGYGANPALARNKDGSANGFDNKLVDLGSLNVNTDAPDANTVFDTRISFAPIATMVNLGVGMRQIEMSALQHLTTTGRLPTGENLVMVTRDAGSGTRNGFMNAIGVDPSWGVGENVGEQNNASAFDLIGPDFLPSNKGGSSRMEGTVRNVRLGVGYTGAERGSGGWLTNGQAEILAVRNDVIGGTEHVRPTIGNILDNGPNGYIVGGPASFATIGDPLAAPAALGGDANGNPTMRNEQAAAYMNNITRSLAAFAAVPGSDETIFSPGEFLAYRFIPPTALDMVQDLTDPLNLQPNVELNQALQDYIRSTNVLGNDPAYQAFGTVTLNGKNPTRTTGVVYTDGVAGGQHYISQGGDAVVYGQNLAARNRIAYDFNGDGVRNMNDAADLVAAWRQRNGGPVWNAPAGTGPIAGAPGADAVIEILGDGDCDGNFTAADVRYWADGLAIDPSTGLLNRKAGFEAVDNAFGGNFFGTAIAGGRPYTPGASRADIAGPSGNVAPGWAPVGADGVVDQHDLDYVIAQYTGNPFVTDGEANWDDLNEAVGFDLSADINGDLKVNEQDADEVRALLGDACPADFNGSGELTLSDFVAFRNAYTAGNMAADFDGNGTLTLSDFVAFRNAYTAGCP